MSDEPRMSPDGEYIQFQMDNPGMHDAPAPAVEKFCDENIESVREIASFRDDAPAPAGGEAEQIYLEFFHTVDGKVKCSNPEDCVEILKAFESRIAATEARVRAEVWREIYRVAQNAPVMRTDNGQQLGKEFVLDEIREAAIEYGIDLTSLAKPE